MKFIKLTMFIITSHFSYSQNLCGPDTLLNLNDINFNNLHFEKIDTLVNEIKYTHIYRCPKSNSIVLGNFSITGKKTGNWKIIDSKGYFFVYGKFKNGKKNGIWQYNGCCRDTYKKGKYKGTRCPYFR